MRLYVNAKEVPYLKNALRDAVIKSSGLEEMQSLQRLLERVELCEELQDNERRGGGQNE